MATKVKDGKTKFKTGFCANGQCEGTKPLSWRGEPMKTCEFWETCPCKCHAEITAMYELAGLDREPPEQSPEYLEKVRRELTEFHMPSRWETDDPSFLLNAPDTFPLRDHEGPPTVPGNTPTTPLSTGPHGTVMPVFTPTATGRRARGQLEFDVLQVCDDFVHDVYEIDICTPRFVAEQIAKRYAIEPPSTGAINAVWDRWEKLGFAKQDRKPSRFVCFEIDGSLQTLEMLKSEAKKAKKRAAANLRRGVRS